MGFRETWSTPVGVVVRSTSVYLEVSTTENPIRTTDSILGNVSGIESKRLCNGVFSISNLLIFSECGNSRATL